MFNSRDRRVSDLVEDCAYDDRIRRSVRVRGGINDECDFLICEVI
jgi:hypothetical protein